MNQPTRATRNAGSSAASRKPAAHHQQRTTQMKFQTSFAASMIRLVVGVILVTMTVAFVTIPYSLSRIPGHPSAPVILEATHHMT